MDYEGRVAKVRAELEGAGVDALLVTNLTNVRYLTGFSGTNGQTLVTSSSAIFMSDPRYESRARSLVRVADVVIYPLKLSDVLGQLLVRDGVTRLGVEAETTTIAQRDELARRLEGVELVPTSKVVERLRRVKDPEEIALIREAVRTADETFDWALEILAPGMSERELALELEIRMRKAGADGVSFDPIVGSGPLSAHIHHTPSERELEKGDFVLLDFGCRWEGYCSDLTRTVVLGSATDEQRTLYDTVLRAQLAGIAAARAGRRCREVDGAARDLIAEAGHGADFGHGLGHGVGLDIHEAPRMNRDADETLLEGDVVTVEPGIYRPGVGGVRIEDCVVLSPGGAEVLGSAPKNRLLEL